MTKYKLLKDLPRAKAGTIVCITNAHSNSPWIVKINKWSEDEQQRPRLAYIHQQDTEEWLEEIRESKSVFNLEFGDDLYVICHGFVNRETFSWFKYQFDYIKQGNWFASKEEAWKEYDKRQIIVKIQQYCWENNIDTNWKEDRRNFFFIWDKHYEKISKNWFESIKQFSPLGYFSKEDAEKILKQFPEELELIYS